VTDDMDLVTLSFLVVPTAGSIWTLSPCQNILQAAELDKRVQGLGIRAYSCE
jgi:hypothetical protein